MEAAKEERNHEGNENMPDSCSCFFLIWSDHKSFGTRWNRIFYGMDFDGGNRYSGRCLFSKRNFQTDINASKIVGIAVCVVIFCSFLLIEGLIIGQMSMPGRDGLDYVIVLGAQVHKDRPSVVLKYRLDRAAE